MKQTLIISLLALSVMALPAQAACYADYKAKKDSPLQLHYGVIELPDRACTSNRAAIAEIAPRLAAQGWTLLNVLSIFDANDLSGRKASAGQFFLRY